MKDISVENSINVLDTFSKVNDEYIIVSHKAIDIAKTIVTSFNIQPNILLTLRNSLQFEYEIGNRYYLEFEIFSNGTINSLKCNLDNILQTAVEEHDITIDRVIEILKGFYG